MGKKDIDAIKKTMKEARIPGVTMAFLGSDKTVETETIGETALNSSTPVVPETIFGAASLSKPVFAYLVLKLIQQEKLILPDGSKLNLDTTPLHELLSLKEFYKQAFDKELSDKDMLKAKSLSYRH
tara:strand:+ start:109 stop:486 length:378 start_codon:yes stop_codon:yes gene_type:complete